MDAHRYWRLYITANWGFAFHVSLANLELRPSPGGANQATPGNGTASSTNIVSGSVAAAFDGNTATTWATDTVSGGWLKWDFGAGNEREVGEVAIIFGNTTNLDTSVRSCLIQHSDDGTAWTTKITITNIPKAVGTNLYSVPIAISVSASASLPAITSSSRSGATTTVSLPVPLSSASCGANSAVALPSFSAAAFGHDSISEQAADITLPSLSAAAFSGASAKATLPGLSLSASGTVTNLANAPIGLPTLTAAASAMVSGTASADLRLPAFSAKSYAGALCSIMVGNLTSLASGTTGGVGKAQVTLPLFEATAVATAQNHGSAQITLPSLSMHSGGNGAAVSLPSLNLTAIGSATITATYEAYAVNLNHTPRPNEQITDEATRYTNFPFTHVVRYQNSYYGANSTGLYLLEGTTDDGAPIPWAFETAMTDFKTPNKKTLASAYFSGRFGPASTIKLIEGEKMPNTYSFTTPRGTLAQNHRQKFGKGTKGRYYALSASGTGTCELDGIEPEVHQLTRRI